MITKKEIKDIAGDRLEKMKSLISKPGIWSQRDNEELERYLLDVELLDLLGRETPKQQEDKHKPFNLANLKSWERDKVENIAIRAFLKNGSLPDDLKPLMAPQQRLAQQSTSTGSGGYTMPEGFVFDLEKALQDYGGMWENARIVKTDRGNVTSWGTLNDTGNPAYILAEAADGTTDAQPLAFGQKQFQGYKYTSGVIQVSNEVLEDSELFVQDLTGVLADRFYRGSNTHFTTGDGSGKPTGAATSAALGYSTTADGDIASNDILELIYSVNTAYRRRGKLMMHSTTLKAIQSKSDSTTEEKPFWLPPYKEDGDPAGTIWGYKVAINDAMASFVGAGTAADDNKKIILFGDFQKYIIRQARDLRIVRLPQRFADKDQTAFIVFMRVDGDIIDAGTQPIKYLRVSTT